MKFINNYPPANRGTIIVWGLLSGLPFGGIFWQVLHHIVGFRRLGFDVWYVEDSDRKIPDPRTWMSTNDYTRAIETLSDIMGRVGFENRWVFRMPREARKCVGGANFAELMKLYKKADAVFNLCGAQEELPYHENIRCRVYLETDPCFPQIRIALGETKTINAYKNYQHIFSYGENIGNDDCLLPLDGFRWIPTRPPVITDWWNPEKEPPKLKRFTTIANWDTKDKGIEWQGDKYYWNKDFKRFKDLPSKSKIPLELAVGRIYEQDKDEILNNNWFFTPAGNIAGLDEYHNYICNSLGEFTVAKDSYVRLKSGWFSDRSVCYLAAGRPVITEETGFNNFIPTGEGLFSFSNEKHILEAIEAIYANYEKHSSRAKEIAEEYFKAEIVLEKIVKIVGI